MMNIPLMVPILLFNRFYCTYKKFYITTPFMVIKHTPLLVLSQKRAHGPYIRLSQGDRPTTFEYHYCGLLRAQRNAYST